MANISELDIIKLTPTQITYLSAMTKHPGFPVFRLLLDGEVDRAMKASVIKDTNDTNEIVNLRQYARAANTVAVNILQLLSHHSDLAARLEDSKAAPSEQHDSFPQEFLS